MKATQLYNKDLLDLLDMSYDGTKQDIIIKVSFKREFIFFLNYSLFSLQIVPFKKLRISGYNNKKDKAMKC